MIDRNDFIQPILIPLIVEGIVMLAFLVTVALWCGIGAGRI